MSDLSTHCSMFPNHKGNFLGISCIVSSDHNMLRKRSERRHGFFSAITLLCNIIPY